MPQKDVNPLSMIPKREDLPEGRSLKDIVNSLHPEIREPVKEVGNLAKLGYDVATGEEAEGLPFGVEMIPGVSLAAKLQQGKTPGLLDFIDIPSLKGLGALKAMPPIVGTLKELKEGGRLGKTLRNIEKAKNPFIERWHRTRSKNDRSIKAKGLLVGKDNPNYGKNTGDESGLPIPAAWLGTSPTEIPVLQYYAMNIPKEVSTYRVRIPKDEYFNTPRMKWDSGYRGDSRDARIVGKGESSLTGEVGRRTGNESLIDLFGKSISPEYLEKIPNRQIQKMKDHAREMRHYRDEHGTPEQTLAEVGNDIVKNEMNSWMPISDRAELYGYRVPTLKSIEYIRPDEILKSANREAMKSPRGIPKYGMQWLAGDLPEKFSTTVKYHKKPDLKGLTNPENVATGHVSRGWQSPVATDEDFKNWDPRWRVFDWKYFKNRLDDGTSPFYAALGARPKIKLTDNPTRGLEPEFIDAAKLSYGKVSRGFESNGGLVSQLGALAREVSARPSGALPLHGHRLADILTDHTSNLNSAALESIATANPSGKFGGLQDALNSARFKFNRGAIARGDEMEPMSLKNYYQNKLEEYASDNEWAYDDTPEGMEDMLESAHRYARDELRSLMKENANYNDDLFKSMRYDKATSPME